MSNAARAAPCELRLMRGYVPLPAFLPDATLGVVRSVDAQDLELAGVQAIVMNVFHLMQKPGSSTIQAVGGLHRFSGWNRPIVTDSGGFQAYSLVRKSGEQARISDRGIRFKPEGAAREFLLTPEKSIQLQLAFGSDVAICLDDCTDPADPMPLQEQAVARTLLWAARCRKEFDILLLQRKSPDSNRPLLFAVVQGGASASLRSRCASALLEIGFDGYGYGGWPLNADGGLMAEMLAATKEAIPGCWPLHALGVGHPESVIRCAAMGYDLFDCALPTRDARSGRLDVECEELARACPRLKTLYIDDLKHFKMNLPISADCDCHTCSRYTVAYLRHLHKCGDSLFLRLATLHNLRFMMRLMERLAALRNER